MPVAYCLRLGTAQRETLEQLRDHGPKAYLRERAAVLLAVADGASIRRAARAAGLKPHDADTVCAWVARYHTMGLSPWASMDCGCARGAGASPPPFPWSRREVHDQLQAVVGQAPAHFGLARSGWWLDGLRQAVSWLTRHCLATVYRALQRAQVAYKRGRRHVHSPDALYAAKLATVAYVRGRAIAEPERIVALYLDELTYYRRPTVAGGYAVVGCHHAPLAEQGWGANTLRRIAAGLDPRTGRLVAWQRRHFDRRTLARFYREAVVPAYPDAQRIYILQDNWPVHFHPDLLAALADTPIRLVRLPTYAPWTNPVEKVWRWLYADVLHLHRFAHRFAGADPSVAAEAGAGEGWEALIQTVQAWLDQFDQPSESLLRYVGLLCPN